MNRLCTEVIGLDGRGAAALYSNVNQWLAACSAVETDPRPPKIDKPSAGMRAPATPMPRKLSYREQQEWEGMEAAILAAEEAVHARTAEVERAATSSHVALADACLALEDAQRTVERLYARWQELESKRGT
jgi:ATP-binding cassette subfamily F protein uup